MELNLLNYIISKFFYKFFFFYRILTYKLLKYEIFMIRKKIKVKKIDKILK